MLEPFALLTNLKKRQDPYNGIGLVHSVDLCVLIF